jgi:hypothetical protein
LRRQREQASQVVVEAQEALVDGFLAFLGEAAGSGETGGGLPLR